MARGRVTCESPTFIKIFKKLASGKYIAWDVWNDFVTITACAISNAVDKAEHHNPVREQMYKDRIKKYTPEEAQMFKSLYFQTVEALEKNPEQDFLGDIFMQLELGSNWKGQFFTPYSVCEAMGSVSVNNVVEEIDQKGYVTVCDPSCGAGATLLGYANAVQDKIYERKRDINWQNHVLFVAQDIDWCAGMMCYIQLSLLGCAGYVKIGDSFANPIQKGDDDKDYWYTPMFFHEVWHMRRMFQAMDSVLGRKKEKTSPHKEPETPPKQEEENGNTATLDKEEKPPEVKMTYATEDSGQLSLF